MHDCTAAGDCSALVRLQRSLRRLCVRLSEESTSEVLAARVLPCLTSLQHLDVIVPRKRDLAVAEKRFRGLVPSVVVSCCWDVQAKAF